MEQVRTMSKIHHDPRRSVVAGVVLATHPSIYTAVHQALAQHRREQKVIEPHALVGAPTVTLVIPERPERSFRLQPPQSVRPALSYESSEGLPGVRLDQRVIV